MSHHTGTFAAFQNTGTGGARFVDSAVLFFDLLGFRHAAEQVRADPDTACREMENLLGTLHRARGTALVDDYFSPVAAAWFTDNVVVAAPTSRHTRRGAIEIVALVAAQLHVGLLVEGVIARGGLAFGQHFMEPDFVFGPALIDAYDLEQGTVAGTKSFRHPSVVLQDMVVEALAGEERGLGRTATPALTLTDSVACYRGEPFLNSLEVHYIASLRSGDFASGMDDERVLAAMIGDYLRNVLTPIRHRIADALDEHASAPNVLAKWVWLADYVDFFLVQREWEELMAPTAWSGDASGIEKDAQTRRTQFSAGGS